MKPRIATLLLLNGQRVRTTTDLQEPQGVLYDASTNRLLEPAG
jgi:hypothetical protein